MYRIHRKITNTKGKHSLSKKAKWLLFLGIIITVLSFGYYLIPSYFGASVYPLSYQNEIISASKEFKVDPNFICAVIYTESHFNPKARSGVGAIGLMQIMPKTGAALATQLGDKDFTPNKLYEPAHNIRYGTLYLSQLLKSYGGSESLVLMHYNGGGRAVNSYRSRGTLPRETQGFVRKVTGTKNVYNQIYGDWWTPKEQFEPLNQKPVSSKIDINQFWKALIIPKGGW